MEQRKFFNKNNIFSHCTILNSCLVSNSKEKFAKYLQQINVGTKTSSTKRYSKNELSGNTGFMTH